MVSRMNNIDFLCRKTINRIYNVVEDHYDNLYDFGDIALNEIREILSSHYADVELIRKVQANNQARSYDQYINGGD